MYCFRHLWRQMNFHLVSRTGSLHLVRIANGSYSVSRSVFHHVSCTVFHHVWITHSYKLKVIVVVILILLCVLCAAAVVSLFASSAVGYCGRRN